MSLYQKIQDANTAVSANQRSLKNLDEECATALARYEKLDARRQAIRLAITSLEEEISDAVNSVAMEDAIPPVDIQGCRNMGERLHRIAQVTGGRVDIVKALDLMESTWPTKAKRDTIGHEIRTWIKQHPQDWENIAPHVYRYKRYGVGSGQGDEDH